MSTQRFILLGSSIFLILSTPSFVIAQDPEDPEPRPPICLAEVSVDTSPFTSAPGVTPAWDSGPYDADVDTSGIVKVDGVCPLGHCSFEVNSIKITLVEGNGVLTRFKLLGGPLLTRVGATSIFTTGDLGDYVWDCAPSSDTSKTFYIRLQAWDSSSSSFVGAGMPDGSGGLNPCGAAITITCSVCE